MRLIDADALLEELPIVEKDEQISLIGAVADMVVLISDAPTIDAVPVVRCKDCEWNDVCKSEGYYLGANGFCSKSKKKDGEAV